MGKVWTSMLHTYACIVVQLLLLCKCGVAQLAIGSMSIDCGSNAVSPYIDSDNIEWTSDAELMKEGETLTVGSEYSAPFNTMRLFSGNQSKYCYSLSNGAVIPGAFFLVRVSFWTGSSPPYTPKSSDGSFSFKLLIDADVWGDISLPNDDTHLIFYEMYTRALRNRIDICLARSTAGNHPFISAIELRPLPSSLSVTRIMNDINRNFITTIHKDDGTAVGSPSVTRYSSDSLDRLWETDSTAPKLVTKAFIDTSKDQERPPVDVLQTAFGGTGTAMLTMTYENQIMNAMYYCVIYFAEIDPRVNASGQRVFNIVLNGDTKVNAEPIDVFAEVGADTSYEFITGPISANEEGIISFAFSATPTSLFPPFFAASELFLASSNAVSNVSSSNDDLYQIILRAA